MTEGDFVSESDLENEWKQIENLFSDFIDNDNKVRPIRFLIRHVIEKGYSKKLFPGSSLFSLLISIPINGKVDYSKTLRIYLNEFTKKIELKYRYNNSIAYSDYSEQTEIIALFENFLLLHEDWKIQIIK